MTRRADTVPSTTTQGVAMTETNEAVITEALSIIDKALGQMMRRELVTTVEVTDVLLDVRSLLTTPAESTLPVSPTVPEPIVASGSVSVS